MSVKQFTQPDFTSQTAAQYKANIDASIEVLGEVGSQFAPRQMGTPGMGIAVAAGLLMDGAVIAAQNVTGIGAPSANPRIDRIYFDLNTRTYGRKVGTESATPTPPALDYGVFPICQILLTVGMTTILNSAITDERTFIMAPVAFFAGDGYTSIISPDGLLRIIIGKGGVDNRVIIRLHNDSDAKVQIQNSSGTPVISMNASGVIKAAGTITQSTTPD